MHEITTYMQFLHAWREILTVSNAICDCYCLQSCNLITRICFLFSLKSCYSGSSNRLQCINMFLIMTATVYEVSVGSRWHASYVSIRSWELVRHQHCLQCYIFCFCFKFTIFSYWLLDVCRSEVFLKPVEDAAVSEITSVLKEWKPLWHQLFTVRQCEYKPYTVLQCLLLWLIFAW